jgi:poly(glycerol-phosphate) alpha-glucosyltransferase
MLDSWALRNSRWKKLLAGWLYEDRHLRGAACLHALNKSEAAAIRAYGLRNPICVIPNGVDLPAQQATVGGEEKLCVFLGRLHPKKGLSILLRAWAQAMWAAAGWRLVVAGWDQGGHEHELRQLAGSLGLDGRVEFVGPKFGVEKAALLRGASAFALPSLSEGLPVAVLEAWSYGLPVVMTPECNLPEGFAAEAAVRMRADVAGVVEALDRLFGMKDEELRAMGVLGRRLVEERFTWARVAMEMMGVYEWVLGRGRRPESVQAG